MAGRAASGLATQVGGVKRTLGGGRGFSFPLAIAEDIPSHPLTGSLPLWERSPREVFVREHHQQQTRRETEQEPFFAAFSPSAI